MARRCDLEGTSYLKGNKVSHSNRKTIKRSQPNLQFKRIWIESQKRFVRMRLTTRAIRTLDKVGIEAVVRRGR